MTGKRRGYKGNSTAPNLGFEEPRKTFPARYLRGWQLAEKEENQTQRDCLGKCYSSLAEGLCPRTRGGTNWSFQVILRRCNLHDLLPSWEHKGERGAENGPWSIAWGTKKMAEGTLEETGFSGRVGGYRWWIQLGILPNLSCLWTAKGQGLDIHIK